MLNTVKQEKAKVLFPSIRNLQVLPPVINLINCLSVEFADVTVISYDLNKDSFQNRIELIPVSEIKYPKSLFSRIKAKSHAYLFMYYYLYKNARKFDYIWIGSWDYKFLDNAARLFGFKGKIIYQFHELEFEKLKYCRKADYCVVPEENRLWITYFFGKLVRKPLLLPNIPFLPLVEFNKMPDELLDLKNEGRKIILYQGLINFEKRCINELLEAISFLPESIVLVIMPMPSTDNIILKQLRERINVMNISKKVFILNSQLPPFHLNYIKYADVGIGLYRPTTLNQIYAAPNRLYEFTKFGVPVILPDFPSFKALSSIYKYGIITVNPESSIGIANTIEDFFEKDNASKGRMQAEIFFNENANYPLKVEKLWSEITK
ncbi:MAG TPA: hypothetical protein VFI29_16440 [Hanamia sp.]|nr:hypothetical protein [Hanamia sp.]